MTLSFEDADAVITDDGLDRMQFWQAYVGCSLYWTESLNSTLSTAWTGQDNAALQPLGFIGMRSCLSSARRDSS